MDFVACIGSRKLNSEERNLCYRIGQFLAQGYNIKSGNAIGADQSYARGVNFINSKQLYLYLPNEKYNNYAIIDGNNVCCKPKKEWFSIAKELHFYWDTMSYTAKSLHARNVGIIEKCKFVIAFPNEDWGGGTLMGMKVAEKYNIPLYNLRIEKTRKEWENLVL